MVRGLRGLRDADSTSRKSGSNSWVVAAIAQSWLSLPRLLVGFIHFRLCHVTIWPTIPSFCFEVISRCHGRSWGSTSHTLISGLQGEASLLSGQSVQNSFAECVSFHCLKLTHFHVFFIWVWRMLYFFIFMYRMIYFYVYVKECPIYLQ